MKKSILTSALAAIAFSASAFAANDNLPYEQTQVDRGLGQSFEWAKSRDDDRLPNRSFQASNEHRHGAQAASNGRSTLGATQSERGEQRNDLRGTPQPYPDPYAPL